MKDVGCDQAGGDADELGGNMDTEAVDDPLGQVVFDHLHHPGSVRSEVSNI